MGESMNCSSQLDASEGQIFSINHSRPEKAYSITSPRQKPPRIGVPAKLLQEMISQQFSGKITICDLEDSSVAWHVYLGKGQLHFATSAVGQVERLTYLSRYTNGAMPHVPQRVTLHSDYAFLCAQWRAGQMTLAHLRSCLLLLTQDAMVQILKMPQAALWMDANLGLDSLIMSVSVPKVIAAMGGPIRHWQQVQPTILSPFQRPRIIDPGRLNHVLFQMGRALPRLHCMEPLLKRNYCIYEIAHELRVSVIDMLLPLQMLAQKRMIEMHPYGNVEAQTNSVIVYIDVAQKFPTPVVQQLKSEGYQVESVADLAQIQLSLTHRPPVLFVINLDPPNFDGYDICRQIRQISSLNAVPIITVSTKFGFVDRVQARMRGVHASLPGPLSAQDLLLVLRSIGANAIAS